MLILSATVVDEAKMATYLKGFTIAKYFSRIFYSFLVDACGMIEIEANT